MTPPDGVWNSPKGPKKRRGGTCWELDQLLRPPRMCDANVGSISTTLGKNQRKRPRGLSERSESSNARASEVGNREESGIGGDALTKARPVQEACAMGENSKATHQGEVATNRTDAHLCPMKKTDAGQKNLECTCKKTKVAPTGQRETKSTRPNQLMRMQKHEIQR